MSLMPVDAALSLVLSDLVPLPAETVAVGDAVGRVLAADLVARRSQPAADMSAMDGYAVRASDIATLPARLPLRGESAAGRPLGAPLAPGTAARIFTGALVPEGADTVVIQENTRREGDDVVVEVETAPGRNIRRKGFDFTKGAVILKAGQRLSARDVMLAAAGNHATLAVRRKPRVAILQTGDELVRPGEASGASDVVMSNVFGLTALARAAGAEVSDLGKVEDTLESTRAAITNARANGFDVLVTSGGASVGEHDLMAPALRAEGVALSVHKIALRPGKPLMYGRGGGMRALGLPGNPVSSYVCAMLFLTPLLKALQGMSDLETPRIPARLAAPVKANDIRLDFMRCTSRPGPDGVPEVTPFALQDSGMISALAQADCLLVRSAFAPEGAVGDACEIILLAD
ncbi:molybdopterin molybdotransferase MoeA [Aquabacter sp. L1I39]|uniref:molybdopterin molybdotransferase MoeA n=1 Tax=Aquabacter sp. L1I39 TaxID=2820278 RepID=UPI001ADB4A50|nr:gephyrin-like molybdotransferase Glp [Aquabacter sp. L1I39]QTL02633.1 molybdopterin molybdotransferase MoeA [Aquabacter sp. L1I39]